MYTCIYLLNSDNYVGIIYLYRLDLSDEVIPVQYVCMHECDNL